MSRVKLPNDKMNDLKGFEEVFDIIEDETNKARAKVKVPDTYDISSFLENEEERLNTLDKLFSKKIPNMVNFPQTELLIKKQMQEKEVALDELKSKLLSPQSPFLKRVSIIFNGYFNDKKATD